MNLQPPAMPTSPITDSKDASPPIQAASRPGLPHAEALGSDNISSIYYDRLDMQRMGKKQELRRNFRLLSSIAFTSCVMGTWEVLLCISNQGLLIAGPAGVFWSLVWAYTGQLFVVLSLAEMASIAPTAGGQYHWVSEFAPRAYQKMLSYASGWLSALALQSFLAVNCFLVARMILGLAVLNDETFILRQWHITLLIMAIVLGLAAFNIFAGKHLALAETVFAAFHFLAVIPIVAILLAFTPRKQSAKVVFLDFGEDIAGWSSTSLAVIVGQLCSFFIVLRSETAAQMSEEVSDAGIVVPRSMIWSYILNIPLTFAILITFLFCIDDVYLAVGSPSGFAFIYVFRKTIGAGAGANVLVHVIVIANLFVAASVFTVTSRQLFAFARDDGVPASGWLAKVHSRYYVPHNSIAATAMFTILLSLLILGSTEAFATIISLGVIALMGTYAISISCFLLKRLRGQRLPPGRWSMGRAGPTVNILALIYTAWAFFWSFWPVEPSPDYATFNWAISIFMAVVILACLEYFVHGRKHYRGPAVKVQSYQ